MPGFVPPQLASLRSGPPASDAVNGAHDKPNVIVFVSHTADIERKDLIAMIAGLPVPGGKLVFMLGRKMQGQGRPGGAQDRSVPVDRVIFAAWNFKLNFSFTTRSIRACCV
jgi:hypothetical protein